MRPILFSFSLPLLGKIELPAYFTLLTVGFGFAMLLTWRESKRIKLDPDRILDMNLWMVVWGIIGARVLHLIADGHFQDYVNLCVDPTRVAAIDPPVGFCNVIAGRDPCGPDFVCDPLGHLCHPPKDCFVAVEVWRGGLAYYGGFLFAIAFALWYMRRRKLPIGRISDLAAPAIALGLFWGRLGCYLNGCCYGTITRSPVGVVFPIWSAVRRAQLDAHQIGAGQPALPVHPTQLYESIACLAISAFLYLVVRPRKRADGQVLGGLMVLYGIARSVIEIFRDDDRGVFFGGRLSTSQLLSIPLVAAGAYLIARPWLSRSATAAPAPRE